MLITIFFVFLTTQPLWQTDAAREGFAKWEVYESFTFEERQQPGAGAILVEFSPLENYYTLGEARMVIGGYPDNRIILNSRRTDMTAADITNVTAHEVGHVVLALLGHYTEGLMYKYYWPTMRQPYPQKLTLFQQWILQERFGRFNPVPYRPAWAWKP